VDVGDRQGAGRRGHGYRCPKWAATQVRFRTGADQRYQEFMGLLRDERAAAHDLVGSSIGTS
jgi:hypothetical protein